MLRDSITITSFYQILNELLKFFLHFKVVRISASPWDGSFSIPPEMWRAVRMQTQDSRTNTQKSETWFRPKLIPKNLFLSLESNHKRTHLQNVDFYSLLPRTRHRSVTLLTFMITSTRKKKPRSFGSKVSEGGEPLKTTHHFQFKARSLSTFPSSSPPRELLQSTWLHTHTHTLHSLVEARGFFAVVIFAASSKTPEAPFKINIPINLFSLLHYLFPPGSSVRSSSLRANLRERKEWDFSSTHEDSSRMIIWKSIAGSRQEFSVAPQVSSMVSWKISNNASRSKQASGERKEQENSVWNFNQNNTSQLPGILLTLITPSHSLLCGVVLTVRKHHQKERSAVESCDFEMVPRSYCGIENNEFIEFTAQVLKCYILLTKKIVEIVSLCNKLQKTDFYDEC